MNEIIKNWAIELKIALFMAVLIALSFLGGLINPIGFIILTFSIPTFVTAIITFVIRLFFGKLSPIVILFLVLPIYIGLLSGFFGLTLFSQISFLFVLTVLAVYIFKFIFFHRVSSEQNDGKPVAGVVLVFILAVLGILLFVVMPKNLYHQKVDFTNLFNPVDSIKNENDDNSKVKTSNEEQNKVISNTDSEFNVSYERFVDKPFGFSFDYPIQITGKIQERTDNDIKSASRYELKLDSNTKVYIYNSFENNMSIENAIADAKNNDDKGGNTNFQIDKVSANSFKESYKDGVGISIQKVVFLLNKPNNYGRNTIEVQSKGNISKKNIDIINHIISTFKPEGN